MLPTLSDVRAEKESRRCLPNEYNGVAPLLVKVGGRYTKITPKLRIVYESLGIIDGEERNRDFKFLILVGGRAGGKSVGVGHAVKEKAKKESTRILCTREVQGSIKDSVHQNLSDWITRDGDGSEFHVTEKAIINEKTGTNFLFKGMKSGTSSKTEGIKSLEGIEVVWFEESQTTNVKSLKKLINTIRVEGCLFIFCMNREDENDAVINYLGKREDSLTVEINYDDNPFLPESMYVEAEHAKQFDYDDYLHEWKGQVSEQNPERTVLPAKWLWQCVGLVAKLGLPNGGKTSAGYDVADGETAKHDKNSLSVRCGNEVTAIDRWQLPYVYDSCKFVDNKYLDYGFQTVTYDVTGMGAGAKSDFEVISREKSGLPYVVRPFSGGGAPHGAETIFVSHGAVDEGKGSIVKNRDFFKNAKTQQWWNLRLRLENSMKLLKGLPVSRDDYYLSFSPDIENIDDVIKELSQATYKEDSSGRKMIDKAPSIDEDTGRRSPNDGDSIGYAFAEDFKYGLRLSGSTTIEEEKPYVMPRMSTRY